MHYGTKATAGAAEGDDPAQLFTRALDLQSMGAFAESERLLARVTQIQPGNLEALMRRGALLMRLNRAKDAMSCYDAVVALRPGDWAPVHDRAVALLAVGRPDLALEGFDLTIAARPDFAPAHFNRGVAFAQLGRLEEAAASYETTLALQPEHLMALNNLGVALGGLGRSDAALDSFERALALQPDCVPVLANRAAPLRQLGRSQDAMESCERALALVPGYPVALYERGRVLERLGRLDEALASFDAATRAQPDYLEAHERTAAVLMDLGRPSTAAQAARQVARLAPRRARAYHDLLELRAMAPGDPELAAMNALAADMAALAPAEQIELGCALGRAHEDLGEPERAFRFFAEAAAQRRSMIAYDEASTLDALRRTAAAFSARVMRRSEGVGDPSTFPVFIVGLPGSAAGLVEQILSACSSFHPGGETEAFLSAMVQFAAEGGLDDSPDAFAGLSRVALRRLGKDYVGRVRPLAPEAVRITDTSVQNLGFLGAIHLALPNARFIHVRRDPVDACLACFTSASRPERLPYAHDLSELGRHWRACQALMAHWREVLPEGVMLEVDYEDLLADPERRIRAMLFFCGLPWTRACLDVPRTSRALGEPGRRRAYEPWLGPLLEALAD
jgi:tetratricopeptide (TPR) repeat protein